jgi:hypothetical protein
MMWLVVGGDFLATTKTWLMINHGKPSDASLQANLHHIVIHSLCFLRLLHIAALRQFGDYFATAEMSITVLLRLPLPRTIIAAINVNNNICS